MILRLEPGDIVFLGDSAFFLIRIKTSVSLSQREKVPNEFKTEKKKEKKSPQINNNTQQLE